MAPRGEGRLVPIPPRVRAIAPPALPLRIFGLALLLALALMVGAKPAAAKTPCWKQVVQAEPQSEYFKEAFDKLGPREADSVPVPLMIMAGLALLLVAAGAGGLITRRFRARRAGPPAT